MSEMGCGGPEQAERRPSWLSSGPYTIRADLKEPAKPDDVESAELSPAIIHMLRWVGSSALLCLVCVALGLGKVMPLLPGMAGLFLVMAALSATVLVGTCKAYDI